MLRQTPAILRTLTEELSEEQARLRPVAERWSVLEVIGHLAHVEEPAFRNRVERMIGEDEPLLASYEPGLHSAAGVYAARPLSETLDAFSRQRDASLEVLRSIDESALERTGRHEKLGRLTVNNLLHEWPLHDLGHVRQVAELVRAICFYPHIGPCRNAYQINP